MASEVVYQIARHKTRNIELRVLGASEFWPGNLLVQKTSATGPHGLFSVRPEEIDIIGTEEART